jgi:anti-anti-sigma factor
MNVDYATVDHVAVIRPSGDLTISSVGALRTGVDSFLTANHGHVLVNLAAVVRIDAAGLGVLALVHRRAASEGAVVTLTNVHHRVRELLDLVGLAACFNIAPSECEALEDSWACELI